MQSGSTPDAQDYYRSIDTPDVNDMELQLQQLVQQGVINPEQAATILQNPSAMNDITTDPSLKQNQMDALLGLQDISDSGGMTTADEANLNKIKTQEDTAARGKREAIIQNAQSRGLGGSGLELMANIQNQQDSATRNSARDLDVAGMAQDRALKALIDQGNLSSQIQQQDFNQGAAKANANDAISKFNATNTQNQINTNVGARNTAQTANLAAKQGIANTNANTANAQQQYNKELLQKDYENKMKKAAGQTGVSQFNASNEGEDARQSAKAQNDSFKMVGQLIGTAAMSDERQKTDVEEFSPSDFLDTLTGYKYKYKDPKKFGEGEHVGVMAQDLEKTEAGSDLVSDTSDGKMVDYSKAGPAIMASLADLNKRIKNIEQGES
jgi:hypothetical protein